MKRAALSPFLCGSGISLSSKIQSLDVAEVVVFVTADGAALFLFRDFGVSQALTSSFHAFFSIVGLGRHFVSPVGDEYVRLFGTEMFSGESGRASGAVFRRQQCV